MNFNILNTIGSTYTESAKKILESLGTVEYLDLSQKEFEEKISSYEILIVGLGLSVTKDALDKASKLKIIATATTGHDHIDVAYAKQKGITVLSLRGENEFLSTITGTAELSFGLMLDLMRMTPWAFRDVQAYHWDREAFRGHNAYEKTLGIVGIGRLGSLMAKYGKAFGMRVLYCDPFVEASRFGEFEKVEFNTLIQKSDVVSIHVHLSEDTENMFNTDVLSRMKRDALLINTSRGKIVNENDLLQALTKKQIGGYAADVLSDELNFNESFTNHPLVEFSKNNKNVIIVPHIGGMTYESREMTDVFIAEKLKKFLER